MIKDRLPDLLQIRKEDKNFTEGADCVVEIYSENLQLDEFFAQLVQIYELLESLSVDNEELKRKHAFILTSPYAIADEGPQNAIDEIMKTVKEKATKIRGKLKAILLECTKLEKENEQNSAWYRIQKMQHSAILHRFRQEMNEYNKAQTDYRDSCKNRIKHQLQITGRITTDEEVEEMIESDNADVFSQGIVIQTLKARQTLADIEARHEDITKLEKSIEELHGIFVDVAALIDSQGELVNNIEKNVSNAGEYAEKGNKQLLEAKNYQSKARRTKMFLIMLVIVIILIIALVIYFSI